MGNSIKTTINITRCKPKTMMSLHHEFGSSEIDGQKVRFCQHVNGLCFWLSIDDDLYQVNTKELMNSVLNAVMESRNA